jgi:nitroimidazol reductase NimA-like FMN-containing flavoprotein (pyridoxamine 5'-phosphate oxidase superfamily)
MLIQEMTKSECQSALAGARLGRLACAYANQPYVVPIYFAYEDPYLYGYTTPGLKVEWMRSNPLVCVELDEVNEHDQWTSIVVFGRYEELPETLEEEQAQLHAPGPDRQKPRPRWTNPAQQERLHAHELLQRHAGWWDAGCASFKQRDPTEPTAPVFYRICIDRITGRRATPHDGGPERSSARTAARDHPGWLRGAFHGFTRSLTGLGRLKSPE